MLLAGQEAFRRQQLEDLDVAVERPAVRARAVAQLRFGFGQGDVQASLARFGAGKQELQSERRLPRAGLAFHQVHVAAGISAREHVIESLYPRFGLRRVLIHGDSIPRDAYLTDLAVRDVPERHTGEK